jgi:hypothetical protein
VLSRKKAGTAIVEFATVKAAVSAAKHVGTTGSPVILGRDPILWAKFYDLHSQVIS